MIIKDFILMFNLIRLKYGKLVDLKMEIILLFLFGINKINYIMDMGYIQL